MTPLKGQLSFYCFPDIATPRKRKLKGRHKKQKHMEAAFNLAVLRIVDGKGSPAANLAVITGMSIDSIKSRACRARYEYTDAQVSEVDGGIALDRDERRYMVEYYKSSKDPAVRSWMGEHVNSAPRKRPDCRTEGNRNKGRAA